MQGFTQTILRAFPPPHYFTICGAGLDLSDESIKFVELADSSHGLILARYGEERIPAGVIVGGQIQRPRELTQSLARMQKKYELTHVVASLPEEQAYVVKVRLPPLRRRELRGGIELQLEELVPLKIGEVDFAYEVVREPSVREAHFDVSVSVLPKKSVASYLEVFAEAGLTPLAFEIEGQALARALVPLGLTPQSTLLVDFGKARTGIALVEQGIMQFGATVDYGGSSLNKEIMQDLEVGEVEAESMKRDFSLVPAEKEKEFSSLVNSSLAILSDEINKYKIFWSDHRDESGEVRAPIDQVILCGGSSNIANIVSVLERAVGVPVRHGDPWVRVAGTKETVPSLPAHESLRYATAIGLALRGSNSV
ncbi:MAG: hypothetical protein COV10_00885 [Candidatus Vogelbacteria bacterium CG10_big_fil_rev_8_21_14_0_10_51_16]|uniref:SHS2 domain-containing protein n=1 Tax=Candidatus Vogelbacteria bacterium CG10_big_fil_rev_8_21_14_0_10_51_16 TaxID=1975045 RepID=A0A2H0RFK2_9BACT|nr:MAG: hypothetical protein COV10_00885 [Candidatus Vogelbacteria bacterium CG10_big_fil_rev_8_21_14_0_10_51_16]